MKIITLIFILFCAVIAFPNRATKIYLWAMEEKTVSESPLVLAQVEGNEFENLAESWAKNVSTRAIEQEKRDDAAQMLIFEKKQQKQNEENERKLKENGERILREYEEFQIAATKKSEENLMKRSSSPLQYRFVRWGDAGTPGTVSKEGNKKSTRPWKGLKKSMRQMSLEELLALDNTPKDREFQDWARQNYKEDEEGKKAVVEWLIGENTYNPVAVEAARRRRRPSVHVPSHHPLILN